jgi:hypothetical protein
LQFLSEDTIKRATLTFMKTYYKFRPRKGETVISYDRMHPSGIAIDGHLEFPKDDGSTFTATFEATSAATSIEVRYSLQRQQLFWDAIAVSSVVTLSVMFGLWLYNFWTIYSAGWLASIALPIVLIFLGILAYHMFFRAAGRYRYIYAIEQFKQYHADEQWIAIGSDIFDDANDPNFLELKNQCIVNGFGLVVVDKQEHVDLLTTPAREEIFGKKRRNLKFLENPSASNLRHFTASDLTRFRRPYMTQAFTCLFALGLLASIYYRQWQIRPILSVSSTENYQDSLSVMNDILKESPEPELMVYKKEDVVKNNATAQPYDPNTPSVSDNANMSKNAIGLYVYTPTDGYLTYDCARAGMRGVKYVVQDILCKNFEEARNRIDILKTYGLIANCISLSCTETTSSGYCVYYELMYNDEVSANAKAIQVKKELAELRLSHDFIKIRTLKF